MPEDPPRSHAARRAAERALVRIVHHYGDRPEFVVLGGLVPEWLCSTSDVQHAGTVDVDVQDSRGWDAVGDLVNRDMGNVGLSDRSVLAGVEIAPVDQNHPFIRQRREPRAFNNGLLASTRHHRQMRSTRAKPRGGARPFLGWQTTSKLWRRW